VGVSIFRDFVVLLSGLFVIPLFALGDDSDPLAVFRGAFEPTVENAAAPPGEAPAGMVWIPGGKFSMGLADPRGLPLGGREAMADARPTACKSMDSGWRKRP
jgi:sulfatase modifying factor 1